MIKISFKISEDRAGVDKINAALAVFGASGGVGVEIGIVDVAEMAAIAAYQEFGTATIPARPFISATIDANKQKYFALMTDLAQRIIDGKSTFESAMLRIGAAVTNDMKLYMTSLSTPPNAPSTVAKKGVNNPLIDTGLLRNAISFRLTKGST